jgi:Trypsin
MCHNRLSVLTPAACALGLSAVLATTLASPALGRSSGQVRAPLASRLAQLRLRTSLRRASAGYGHFVRHHATGTARRPRIIGGYNAAAGDWGFMAFILHIDAAGNPDFACTGTIVAPNVVLTAGHCTVDEVTGATLNPSGFGVVTGSLDWSNASQRQLSLVSKVITNPVYSPITDSFDAGLLVLSTPTTAPSIPLATSADAYLDQAATGAFIAGWGATYNGGPPVTYLQSASTVVQSSAYCAQFDPYFDGSSELCTVNPPDYLTGTCTGDSGGPLAALDAADHLVEIGITTNGPADCNTYTADDFANVIPLYSWATSWIRAVAPPPPPPPAPPPAPPAAPPPSQPSQPSSASSLPTMTLGHARRYVRQTLRGALGQRFKPARNYSAKCSRKSGTRFMCGVQFWHGPNDYWGNVSVWLTSGPGGLTEWTDTYTIHWVNDQCYYHSGHPSQCAIHTRHGTW